MRKTFLAALGLGLAPAALLAQEAPAPRPATGPGYPRVAVIDMQEVSAQSQLGKGYAGRLEALKSEIDQEGTKKQAELQKLDAAIKALQDELDKQGSVLSPDAADRKRQEIVKRQRERQAFLEDGQQDLQRMRERAQQQAQILNNEFQQKIRPHIEAVAKEKGIDILLDSQVALTVNNAFDISKDVIARADAAERAGKGAGGGAAAGASPAAPKAGGAPAGAATTPKPGPAAGAPGATKGSPAPPAPAPAPTPAPSPSPSPQP